MDNIENLVTEEVTENVEETTTEEIVEEQVNEQPEKIYTQEEFDQKFNDGVGKKLARQEAKIRKENDRKYSPLLNVLKAGLGTEDVSEMTEILTDFYKKRGKEIPQQPEYSNNDIKVLAKAEADEIIKLGFDEAVEEADRLNGVSFDKMSERDKAVFVQLTDYIKNTETSRELDKLGVSSDLYNSKEFKDFASKFSSNTPISEIYEIYNKTIPKKQIQTMGSMKQSQNNGVKDYYSPEEIERLTEEDLDNPKVWEAVRRSMTGG